MYRGKSIYTEIALKSILEQWDGEKTWKEYEKLEELKIKKACFVTLHLKNGDLRGCIGTLEPYREDLLEEIIGNAKSSAFGDPRFNRVTRRELEEIEISVDVLDIPEKIEDKEKLDPKIYGVIVEKGRRKGVLLPDLDGIDTVDEQLSIAMEKAGIYTEDGVQIYRFRVKRYY